MSEATCKTCGGTPGHHVPSVLDPNGIGDPGHKTEPTKPIDDERRAYTMTRDHFRRITDEIMHYTTKELDADKMTMLPFVTNITEAIRPIIEHIITADRKQLLDRVEKIIGKDAEVTGSIRPNGNPSIDLTESYYNALRAEQRIDLAKLRKEYLGDE